MRQLLLVALLLPAIFTSCYQYSDVTYLDELDLTYTEYNDTVDFTPYTTFAVRDCVVLVENHWKDSEIEAFYASGGGSDKIVSAIIDKFKEEGWTLVDDTVSIDSADVAINPVLMHLKHTETVWYPPSYPPGYWWGYWPYYGYSGASSYYYPGWGWGGWYPWYGYSYSYKTGTIDLEMADASTIQALNELLSGKTAEELTEIKSDLPEIGLIWHAMIDGYVSSDKAYNDARALNGLDEAFNQSPYLTRN